MSVGLWNDNYLFRHAKWIPNFLYLIELISKKYKSFSNFKNIVI
jgi:hypothetical protein